MKLRRPPHQTLAVRRVGVDESPWQDLYHRLSRLTWPRFFGVLLLVFFVMNAVFAELYYLSPGSIANIPPKAWFSNLAFSIQTMSTIGYGYFYPQSATGHFLVTCEAVIGICFTAILTGLVFAKFSRPGSRIAFSQNAILAKQNKQDILSLRLGNVRTNRVYEGRATLALLRDEVTAEGEKIRRIVDLKLLRSETPLFTLSWTLVHVIDESSPLFRVSIEHMQKEGWELVVTFIGIDQDLSQNVIGHTLYSADRIVRARKFRDMIEREGATRVIDFSKLHDIEVE